MNIKWGKSSDGNVYSKCGEYQISPLYWGSCSAQGYELTVVNNRNDSGVKERLVFNCDTQAEAKIKADLHKLNK